MLGKRPAPGELGGLSPQGLEGLWATLAEDDARTAYQAIQSLVFESEKAVPFLKERMRPVLEPNANQLSSWIADLDSDEFAVRQKATQALEQLDNLAEATLRKKLAEKPSPEVCRQIEDLLKSKELRPGVLQALRGLEALELIGNNEATEVLKTMASGTEAAVLTQEAKASMGRLKKRDLRKNK